MKTKNFVMTLGLCASVLSPSAIAQGYNAIDAVTSASGELELLSGNAYPTYATVTWTDAYNNGSQHLLKYGTSTSYGTNINLSPFSAYTDITTTIPDLSASTLYYGQFYRYYRGSAYTTEFQFTTADNTTSVLPGARIVDFRITGETSISVVDVAGRTIRTLSSGEIASLDSDKGTLITNQLAPGIYMAIHANHMSHSRTFKKLVVTR